MKVASQAITERHSKRFEIGGAPPCRLDCQAQSATQITDYTSALDATVTKGGVILADSYKCRQSLVEADWAHGIASNRPSAQSANAIPSTAERAA